MTKYGKHYVSNKNRIMCKAGTGAVLQKPTHEMLMGDLNNDIRTI